MTTNTDLVVSGLSIPTCATRGLVEEIGVIEQSRQLKRTVNGTLVDLSDSNFRKRKWRVSGKDLRVPDFSSAWPGMAITITSTATPMGSGHLTIVGMLVDWTTSYDEWEASASWTMDVEEI
jgi:hypothetical protein